MHSDAQRWRDAAQHFSFEGQQIAYWAGGSGRPLLLVHGFPTCSWDWAAMWEALAQDHSLIACDMLGFGLSDKPPDEYRLMRQASLQQALLDHLGIDEFDALVHDYGVSVGQELLARQQEGSGAEGLGQMVFLNGGIFPSKHHPRPIQRVGASPLGFVVSMLMNRQRFGKSFAEVFGPDTQPSAEELDIFWDFISHNNGHRRTHKLLRYMAERRDNALRWGGALVPAQERIGLINGALDPVSGEHLYDEWRIRVPLARHHLLPNVGHYPQVEAPGEVSAKVLEWLATQPVA